MVLMIPVERYGAVTRATEQPHAVERLVSWLRRAAPIRAKASLGCDDALSLAPNFVPIRKQTKVQAMARAVSEFCDESGYSARIKRAAIETGLFRMRHGASNGAAITSAKIRAEHLAVTYGPQGAA